MVILILTPLDRQLLNCPTLAEVLTTEAGIYATQAFLTVSKRYLSGNPFIYSMTVGLMRLHRKNNHHSLGPVRRSRLSSEISGSSLVTACSLHRAHYLRMLSRTLGCPIRTRIPKDLVHRSQLHSEDFGVRCRAAEHALTDTGN